LARIIELSSIGKQYPSGSQFALDNISFDLNSSEILGIVGRSGSGKSTLLKIIAGNIDSDKGEIYFLEKKLPKPADLLIKAFDRIAIVNQDFKLPPRHTVKENLKYPLRRMSRDYQTTRVQELATKLELTAFIDSMTNTLSGGQLQRLAIARALASDPALLLLDEPFNQLDFATKLSLKKMLFSIVQDSEISIILVSHDPSDFLSFVNTTIVLKDGQIKEKGNPEEIYLQPKNLYTARLFGFINVFTTQELNEFLISERQEGNYSIRPEYINLDKNGYAAQVKNLHLFSHYYIIEVVGLNKKSIFIARHFMDEKPKLGDWIKIQINSKFLFPITIE
jgi:ABC-type Fe3+/spermidine/putrescine transport system ATPase subunit